MAGTTEPHHPQDDGFGGRNRFLTETPLSSPRGAERAAGGLSLSLAAHVVALVVVTMIVARSPTDLIEETRAVPTRLVFTVEGTGAPKGGGGEKAPAPTRRAQLVGGDALAIPRMSEPSLQPTEILPPAPVIEHAVAPAPEVRSGLTDAVGAISNVPTLDSGTRGLGSGSGSNTGDGPGGGQGPGPGGLGSDGTGLQPGNGVSRPRLVREIKPNYTASAMHARVEGLVELEVVVLADGSVGLVRLVRSLDGRFGLDEEAIKAVRLWRFEPGRQLGRAVDVRVQVEVSFQLR